VIAVEPVFKDALGAHPVRVNNGLDNEVANVTSSPASYRGELPEDLVPGDWVRVGAHGETLGVLSRSGVILKASSMAQILAVNGPNEGLTIGARNLKLFTGMGDLELGNERGKAFLDFKGGVDQTEETGVDRERWTTRLTIGRPGNLYLHGFYTGDGNALYEQRLTPAGEFMVTLAGNRVDSIGGDQTKTVGGSSEVSIAGSVSETVDRDTLLTLGGSRTVDVGQNYSLMVKNDLYTTVNRDHAVSVGRTGTLNVGGSVLAKPGDPSYSINVANGDMVVDVGRPGAELSAAQSSFKLTVYPVNGSVSLRALAGNLELTADTRDVQVSAGKAWVRSATTSELTVKLGGTEKYGTTQDVTVGTQYTLNAPQVLLAASQGVAVDPAVLWNELYAYLTSLAAALDAHFHMATLPMSPTSPPTTPVFSTTLQAQAMTFRSKKVMLGG